MRYSASPLKTRAGLGVVAGLGLMTLALLRDEPRAIARPTPDATPSETITLFDGKDLKGWEGLEKYWSVVDGEIVGKNTRPVDVSTYLVTKRQFSDFRLTYKAKLVTSEMHSGIAFWGKTAPEKGDQYTYMGHLVMFPSDWGMYDLYRRGGLKVDGKPAKEAAKGRQHDWNDMEILAIGHRVRLAVNGLAVVDFTDPNPDWITQGPIGLQLHSNQEPQEVRFKDLVIETSPKLDKLTTVKP